MANESEEKRDMLFDMSLGDGLIEIDEVSKASTEEAKTPPAESGKTNDASDKEVDRTVNGVTYYKDGSFEINDIPAAKSDNSEKDESETFIDKTETGKETKEKETPSEADPSESSSSSPYLAFAKDRANEGVFLEFNDEDWKTLVERNDGDEAAALRELSNISIQEMISAGIEEYKNSITPEERMLYDAKDKGLPVDEYSVAQRNFNKYSKIKEDDLSENVELQEEIVSKVLELKGFTPEDIKEEIEGYKALENLEAKAKKFLPVLPETFKGKMNNIEQNVKDQEDARKDKIRQRVARMKRNIDNTPEIIPGIKLTKAVRENIMKSMTNPIAKTKDGQPLNSVMATRAKNPDAFEMMVHYYHSLGLFNITDDGQINPDFSKIAKVEKSKAVDEFKNAFESKTKPGTGKAPAAGQGMDAIDEFEDAFGRL